MEAFNVSVFCTLQVEGLHAWADCNIDEVSYLKYPHRHTFFIKAHTYALSHADRDIEFIELQHNIREYLRIRYYTNEFNCHNFGNMSCEHIAIDLLEMFPQLAKVEVSEDNENGSIVERQVAFVDGGGVNND